MSLRTDLEKLDNGCWENSYIKIKPIVTQNELVYVGAECQLNDDQKDLVNPFWFTMGRAYLFRDDNYPCIIYNENNEPIGFINLNIWYGSADAYSWSFYIDQSHQGKGYGRSSAELAIRILKSANPSKQIKLATERSNLKAQSIYLSLGFEKSDEMDGDDLVFIF